MKIAIIGAGKPNIPKQRVSEKYAKIILEKLIDNFDSKTERAVIYDEDYAGGKQDFINSTIVYNLIKKLTK